MAEAEEDDWMDKILLGEPGGETGEEDAAAVRWSESRVEVSSPLSGPEQKQLMKRRMSKAKKLVADLGLKQDKGEGLVDLSFLPKFAGEDVRALNEEVLQIERELRDVEEAVEEQEERATVMNDHTKRVQQEITYTQLRADSKRRAFATEENLRKISDMEAKRLQREIVRIDKESDELNDRMRGLKAAINSGNEEMDHFRLLMQWNQEELYEWMQAARQKDEDNMALQSYTKADNSKLKELYLESEKASSELYALQQKLDDEITETQSAQIQLNRTAEVFRDLQAERRKLVNNWEETIETIHSRDEAIHKAAEDFATNKATLRRMKRQLDAAASTLEKEIDGNHALDKKVQMTEDDLKGMRDNLKGILASAKTAEDELDLVKSRVQRAVVDLASERARKSQVQEDLANKRQKLEAVDRKLLDLKMKVEDEYSLLDTLDKKRNELEKILASEEVNLKVAKKEVSDLREQHFKECEKLNDVKAREKDILFEIHGAKSQAKSLNNQIHQLEANMIKQEEVLYSAEFQIQCLERKVARAGGETSDVEAREFNAKIVQLEQELEEKKSEEVIVLQQLKKSQDDLRAAIRRRDELTRRLSQAEEKNAELGLESETGLHTLKGFVKEKEEKMLARDLLQMEVNRLQALLNQKADAVYGMESAKKRLEMSMEECRREIERRHERHVSELRSLQEDLHHLLLQRNKLAVAVDKLQAKYEVVLKRVKIEGHERSPNYFIIKAAQEREEIQREGYRLEQEVKQVQTDVTALEKAFEDVKQANNLYRNSHKTAATLKLEEDQSHLRELLTDAMNSLNDKEAEEQVLIREVEDAEHRIANAEREHSDAIEVLKDMEIQVHTAEKENEHQSQKQRRATVRFEKLSTKLKESYGNEDAERIAKEMQLAEARETVMDVLYKLKAMVQENPDMGHRIHDRVAEAGFKMPSNTSSVKSSVAGGSTRASISSRGSVFSARASRSSMRSSRSGSVINVDFSELSAA